MAEDHSERGGEDRDEEESPEPVETGQDDVDPSDDASEPEEDAEAAEEPVAEEAPAESDAETVDDARSEAGRAEEQPITAADASSDVSGTVAAPPLADASAETPQPQGLGGRIATTIRQSAVGQGAEMLSQRLPGLRREVMFPLITLAALVFLVVAFRSILLPFIFAVIIVYLMEPIVRRIGRTPSSPRGLPRWVAVILVYLVFIGVTATALILVVPRFVTEIVRLGETVPETVQEFRTERLPGINNRLQQFVRSYMPVNEPEATNNAALAQQRVRQARIAAARRATAWGNAVARAHRAEQTHIGWSLEDEGVGQTVRKFLVEPAQTPMPRLTLDQALGNESRGWVFADAGDRAPIRVEPAAHGAGYNIFLSESGLRVSKVDDDVWTIQRQSANEVPVQKQSVAIDEMFNLERTLDDILENLASTSSERLASLVQFAQKLVVGVVGALVAVVLTLMVAAFISIDLPRVMGFFRSLVPAEGRRGFDVLVRRLDRGLAGVVRGQLLICLINGSLTYIGLLILGVKFSVLLAVVAGILSLIPVFGTVLSTVPIVLIALTDGLMTGVLALAWVLGVHFTEANFLNPKIIGTSAHIHPVIVIFALLAGEHAYGLVGALLAVPTTSILLTLFDFVRTRGWKEAATDEAPAQGAPT